MSYIQYCISLFCHQTISFSDNGNSGDGQIKGPQNAAGEAAGLREPKWRGQAAGSKGESWLSDRCVCVSVCVVCVQVYREQGKRFL